MYLRFHPIETGFDGRSTKPMPTLGSLLCQATRSNELTASRYNHPTIGRFLRLNMADKVATQLVNNSKNPKSPTKAYLLFDRVIKIDKLVGAAVVADDVDLYQKFSDCKRTRLFKASLCVTWLGVGGQKEFMEACAMTRDVATGLDRVAIEPVASDPRVHAALAEVFGPGTDGMFGTGVGPTVLKPSLIYRTPL